MLAIATLVLQCTTHVLSSQGVERVVFVGNYLCNNELSMRMLAYAMEYWSQQTISGSLPAARRLLWCSGQHLVETGLTLSPTSTYYNTMQPQH